MGPVTNHSSASGWYACAFVISGVVSQFSLLTAHIAPTYCSEVFSISLGAPVIIALAYREFQAVYSGAGLASWFWTTVRYTGFVAILLFLFSGPTAVAEFHSWAILYGSTAAFLLSLLARDLSRLLDSRRWLPAVFLPWMAATLVDRSAKMAFLPTEVAFPNGVVLGYNLFFLFDSFSICMLSTLYPTRPVPQIKASQILAVAVGCLAGYAISIPVLEVLLMFMMDDTGSFVVAQCARIGLVNLGGSILGVLVTPSHVLKSPPMTNDGPA